MNQKALHMMLEASSDAGMLLTADGMVLRMNAAAYAIFDPSGRLTNERKSKQPCHISRFLRVQLNDGESGEDWWNELTFDLGNSARAHKGTAQNFDGKSSPVKVLCARLDRRGKAKKFSSGADDCRSVTSACSAGSKSTASTGKREGTGGVALSSFFWSSPLAFCFYVTGFQAKVSAIEEEIAVFKRTPDLADPKLERMEHAVNEAFDPMFIIDQLGFILMANKAAVRQFGWTLDEFLSNKINMIAAGGHGERHDQYMSNYLETGVKHVIGKKRKLVARRKDNSTFPIELGVTEVVSQRAQADSMRFFCGYVRDISETERAAEELLAKQEMTNALVDSSFEPMFQITEEGIIQMVNQAAVRVFGYSKTEFIGQNISMIVGGGHATKHDSYLRHYLQTGEKRVIGKQRQLVARRRDGSSFPIQLGISEAKTKRGQRLFCGFVSDLSQREKAEQDRLHHAELLKGMIDASFDPMFQIDQNGIILLANSAAVDLFGWTREEFSGKNISMIMPPSHGQNHNIYMSNYFASGKKRVIGKRRQLPAMKRDGTVFPIELGVKEVASPWGKRFFCGYIKDMTSTHSDQERLTRKEALTIGMIDSAFDPMFLINEFGIVHMVNQAACRVFGYEREELLGTNISIICGGKHGEPGVHNGYLQRYLKTGEKRVIGQRRTLQAVTKDGTEFPIELGVSEVKTIWKETFFCGFVRDVRQKHHDGREMEEKRRLHAGILESSADGLFAMDEHLTICLANSAASRLLGYDDPKTMLGTNLATFFVDECREAKVAKLDRFFQQSEANVKGREPLTFRDQFDCLRRQDGPSNASAESVASSGDDIGSVGVGTAAAAAAAAPPSIRVLVEVSVTEIPGPFPNLLSSESGQVRGKRCFAVSFHGVRSNPPEHQQRHARGIMSVLRGKWETKDDLHDGGASFMTDFSGQPSRQAHQEVELPFEHLHLKEDSVSGI